MHRRFEKDGNRSSGFKIPSVSISRSESGRMIAADVSAMLLSVRLSNAYTV